MLAMILTYIHVAQTLLVGWGGALFFFVLLQTDQLKVKVLLEVVSFYDDRDNDTC